MIRLSSFTLAAAAAVAALAGVPAAQATTAVVFGNIDSATAAFNATVAAAGGTVSADVVSTFNGPTYAGTGYTITSPISGGSLSANPYNI